MLRPATLLLFCLSVAVSGRPTLSVESLALAALPADRPIRNGAAVNSICGRCCQDGSYCGQLAQEVSLVEHSSVPRELAIPKGSNLTCLLRARDVFGAVDGGLCVPSAFPRLSSKKSFCTDLDQTLLPSYTLTGVVYQADLATQATCGPCCDGQHTCDAFSVCRPRRDGTGGICLPHDTKHKSTCGEDLLSDKVLQCESCNKPSPAAQLFESEHHLS